MPNIQGVYFEPNASTYVSTVAGETTAVVKASPGRLFFLRIVNTTGAKIYAFVFDNNAASGTLLMPPIPIGANDHYAVSIPAALAFSTGLTVSSSSTPKTYTAGAANDLQAHAIFK